MFANNKICFIESSNARSISFTSVDDTMPSDKIGFRLQFGQSMPMNIYYNQNVYVTLKVGAFSTLESNNLIANSLYVKENDNSKYEPFDENKKYFKKVELKNNTAIYKKNIGTNESEDFDDLFEYPFEDINVSLYDRRIPHYRQYVNAFNVHQLDQSISILGNFEEITGKVLTENLFKGISAYLSNNDARGRSFQIEDSYLINESTQEGFLDVEIENNVSNDSLIKRSFKYETRVINGTEQTVLILDEQSFSYSKALTKTILYYNEENMFISPFNDSLTEDEALLNTRTTSRGSDGDFSNSEYVSLGRLGEID